MCHIHLRKKLFKMKNSKNDFPLVWSKTKPPAHLCLWWWHWGDKLQAGEVPGGNLTPAPWAWEAAGLGTACWPCFLFDARAALRLRPLNLHRRFQAFENRQMGLWQVVLPGFMKRFFLMERWRPLGAVPSKLQACISHCYPEFGVPGRCDLGSHRQVHHVNSSPGAAAHCVTECEFS